MFFPSTSPKITATLLQPANQKGDVLSIMEVIVRGTVRFYIQSHSSASGMDRRFFCTAKPWAKYRDYWEVFIWASPHILQTSWVADLSLLLSITEWWKGLLSWWEMNCYYLSPHTQTKLNDACPWADHPCIAGTKKVAVWSGASLIWMRWIMECFCQAFFFLPDVHEKDLDTMTFQPTETTEKSRKKVGGSRVEFWLLYGLQSDHHISPIEFRRCCSISERFWIFPWCQDATWLADRMSLSAKNG